MSDSVEFLRSENLQDGSRWFADAQGCTYVNHVYFGGNDVQCDGKCLNVLSMSTFLTQAVDPSLYKPEMAGKTFILSFRALARQVSSMAGGGTVSINATDGFTSQLFSMPLTAQNETNARFTPQRLEFTIPPEAKNGMNVTFQLKDPNSPNNATLYFDELSFKPDAVVVLQSEKAPMSAIVGGVVGGVALLVAVAILVYLWVVRRRKQLAKEKEEQEKDREAMAANGSNDPLVDPAAAVLNNNNVNGGGGGYDGSGVPIVRSPVASQQFQQRPYSTANPTPSVHTPTPHPPSVHSPQFERRSLHQQSHHAPSVMSGNSGNNNSIGLGLGGADLDRQNTMLPAYPTSNQDNQSVHSMPPPPHAATSPVYSNRPTSPVTDLESFARANPYLIDAVLLEKLRKARYSPLTNPNVMTEHEWYQRFNVNKLEYERIVEAYNVASAQGAPMGYDAL